MRFFHRIRAAVVAFAIATPFAIAGCHGCHEDHPYTPYKLGEGSTSSEGPAAPASDVSDAGDAGFALVPAQVAKGDGHTWSLGGVDVKAPVGRVFALGLEVDADGDGKDDLVAWARSSDGLRGEVVFVSSASPGDVHTVVALPGDLAPAGCTAKTSLVAFGPRSAAFDFRPNCPPELRDRAARYLAVVRWPLAADGHAGGAELGLDLKLGPATDGDAIDVAPTAIDRDGDGRADVVLTLSLAGAPPGLPPGQANATLVYFDRPAGLSRDPSEPEASIRAALGVVGADAHKPKGSARVFANAEALRRLVAAICDESGHSVLSTNAGRVHCGDVKIEGEVAVAEVEAALNQGEPAAAMAAVARVDATSPSAARKKDIDRLLAKPIPALNVVGARTLVAVPAASGSSSFGSLAFLANDDLLVRAESGIVRADKAALAESPAEPRRWPTALGFPLNEPVWKLSRVERRCQDPTLVAHFDVKRDGAFGDFAVPLPIPTPAACTPSNALAVTPLGSNSFGALVAVGADVVQIPLENTPVAKAPDALLAEPLTDEQVGSARSPDGLSFAVLTSRGVLVGTVEGRTRHAKAARFVGSSFEQATFCVPSNGASRLACVIGGHVVVADRPAK